MFNPGDAAITTTPEKPQSPSSASRTPTTATPCRVKHCIDAASVHCQECSRPMCYRHFEYHNTALKAAIGEDHKGISIAGSKLLYSVNSPFGGNASDEIVRKCEIHPDRTYEMYCRTCSTVVCVMCAFSPAHQEHLSTIVLIKDQALSIERFVDEKLKNLGTLRMKLDRTHQKLHAMLGRLETDSNIAREQISSKFDAIVQAINAKKGQLLTQIQDIQSKRMRQLRDQIVKVEELRMAEVKKTQEINAILNETLNDQIDLVTRIDENSPFLKQFEFADLKEELTLLIPTLSSLNITHSINNVQSIVEEIGKIGNVSDKSQEFVYREDLFAESKIMDIRMQMELAELYGDTSKRWSLLYRASRDGFSAQQFHLKCDGQGPTITVIRVGDYVFGGYTPISWHTRGSSYDDQTFIFTLRNPVGTAPQKFPRLRNGCSIFGSSSRGPSFGNGIDICITDTQSFFNPGNSFAIPDHKYNTKEAKEFLCGVAWCRQVTDYEVFVMEAVKPKPSETIMTSSTTLAWSSVKIEPHLEPNVDNIALSETYSFESPRTTSFFSDDTNPFSAMPEEDYKDVELRESARMSVFGYIQDNTAAVSDNNPFHDNIEEWRKQSVLSPSKDLIEEGSITISPAKSEISVSEDLIQNGLSHEHLLRRNTAVSASPFPFLDPSLVVEPTKQLEATFASPGFARPVQSDVLMPGDDLLLFSDSPLPSPKRAERQQDFSMQYKDSKMNTPREKETPAQALNRIQDHLQEILNSARQPTPSSEEHTKY